LKAIQTEYAEKVAFYIVGSDPGESLATWESYREKQGFPWAVGIAQGTTLRDLNVQVQSTKLAFDSRGVIIYRDGYAQGNADKWRQVFQELAASAK